MDKRTNMIKIATPKPHQYTFNVNQAQHVNFYGQLPKPKDTFEKQEAKENVEQKPYNFYKQLSKKMAYALRHKPQECHLVMDSKGYVNINELLEYIKADKHFKNIDLNEIKNCMETIEKKRFELIDNKKIRAYYGHSCKNKITKEEAIPPKILYHGTARSVKDKILQEGLTKQTRQYVHLSTDIKTATSVGSRKDDKPVILKINAQKAAQDGIKFYLGNQNIWLADYLPPEYIQK